MGVSREVEQDAEQDGDWRRESRGGRHREGKDQERLEEDEAHTPGEVRFEEIGILEQLDGGGIPQDDAVRVASPDDDPERLVILDEMIGEATMASIGRGFNRKDRRKKGIK